MNYPMAALLVSPNSPWRITIANQDLAEYRAVFASGNQHWRELLASNSLAFAAIEIAADSDVVPVARLVSGHAFQIQNRRSLRPPIFALATNGDLAFVQKELLAAGCAWVCTQPEEFETLAAKAISVTVGNRTEESSVGQYVDDVLPWKRHGKPQFSAIYSRWNASPNPA